MSAYPPLSPPLLGKFSPQNTLFTPLIYLSGYSMKGTILHTAFSLKQTEAEIALQKGSKIWNIKILSNLKRRFTQLSLSDAEPYFKPYQTKWQNFRIYPCTVKGGQEKPRCLNISPILILLSNCPKTISPYTSILMELRIKMRLLSGRKSLMPLQNRSGKGFLI